MANKGKAARERILAFVTEFVEGRGFPPTLGEISKACGVENRSSVDYHLKVLQSQGSLRRAERRHRGLELLASPLRLPILGRVGAGGGVIAQEDVQGHLALGRELGKGVDFLLRVRGDSMTGAGILEGDLVQVRKQDKAEDGDTVVALVEEEGVVKTLRRHEGSWRLESANPAYKPILQEFQVIGKVVGLVRCYE